MSDLPLGRDVEYVDQYAPQLLCAIDRRQSRSSLGIIGGALPFYGVDIWNAYEISWLNLKGKPQVACAEFRFPCDLEYIIESKSFKLYLNSFNQTRFEDSSAVQKILQQDLSKVAKGQVDVVIAEGCIGVGQPIQTFAGECLDHLDITVDSYQPSSILLSTDSQSELISETLVSHLLRSLCPVTGQPDWGSVVIRYTGTAINREGLLLYLIGYRQHQEFHEQCVERIFTDIMERCQPAQLSVYARYVRRGGLDINPFRSTIDEVPANIRLQRQ